MWMRYLKRLKYGFTVKVKNIYIQVQNALYVKRIVTRLAVFQLSEVQSRSSNGSHKSINYNGTPLMWPPLGHKTLVVKMRRSAMNGWFSKKIKIKISLISTFEWR